MKLTKEQIAALWKIAMSYPRAADQQVLVSFMKRVEVDNSRHIVRDETTGKSYEV